MCSLWTILQKKSRCQKGPYYKKMYFILKTLIRKLFAELFISKEMLTINFLSVQICILKTRGVITFLNQLLQIFFTQ